MRALDLDFVAPKRAAGGSGAPLLVAAAIALASVMIWHGEMRGDLESLEQRLAKSDGNSRRPLAAPAAAGQAADQEIRQVNEIIEQISLPWDRVFHAVEGASVAGVRLLGIEPDAASGTVRIDAETAASDAMFGYVNRLSQDSGLSDVYLLQHRMEKLNPAQPLQFTVTASWIERTP